MAHLPFAISKYQTYLGNNSLLINPLTCSVIYRNQLQNPCQNLVYNSSFVWKSRSSQFGSHQVASRKWLVSKVQILEAECSYFIALSIYLMNLQCHSRNSVSPDDEFRSSRNIAISLFRRYRNVIDRGGGDNLKVYIYIFRGLLHLLCLWRHAFFFFHITSFE